MCFVRLKHSRGGTGTLREAGRKPDLEGGAKGLGPRLNPWFADYERERGPGSDLGEEIEQTRSAIPQQNGIHHAASQENATRES